MIKYNVNGDFVDKDTFYDKLKNHYDAAPQRLTYDQYLEQLVLRGEVCLKTAKGKFEYFCAADEEVFELEQIVADSEYDPLDGDAFAIAFAVYQKGFRKQRE